MPFLLFNAIAKVKSDLSTCKYNYIRKQQCLFITYFVRREIVFYFTVLLKYQLYNTLQLKFYMQYNYLNGWWSVTRYCYSKVQHKVTVWIATVEQKQKQKIAILNPVSLYLIVERCAGCKTTCIWPLKGVLVVKLINDIFFTYVIHVWYCASAQFLCVLVIL